MVKEHELKSPVSWQLLNVVDARTGLLEHRVKPVIRNVAHCYTAAAAAGKLLYLVDSGDPSSGCWTPRPGGPDAESLVGVVDTDTCQVLATNPMPRLQAPLCFAGEEIFIRTHRELICIGPTEGGEAYAAAACQRQLFDELARFPEPDAPEVAAVAPPPDLKAPADLPTGRLDPLPGGVPLLVAGPFPADGRDHLAKLGGMAKAQVAPGTQVGDRSFARLPRGRITGEGSFAHFFLDYIGEGDPIGTWYYASYLKVIRERVVRFDSKMLGATVYLSGRQLEHGEHLRLAPGTHPFLLQLQVHKLPPAGLAAVAGFGLRPRPDPAAARADWLRKIAPYAPRLRRFMTGNPKGGASLRARRLLALIDGAGDGESGD